MTSFFFENNKNIGYDCKVVLNVIFLINGMTTSLNKESKTRHSPLLNHQTVHDVVVNQQQSLPFNQDNLLDASINHNHDIPLIKSTSFRDFLSSPVDIKHVDLILLSHSLSTGIVDAATFSNWSVFVGMQTGT